VVELRFERYGIGIAKGMALTFKHLFRKPITTQYPEERLTVSRRARGNELIWDKELCVACTACARACPHGCIEMVTSKGADDKRIVDKFQLDTGRCIFCGLCVEACPKECLFIGCGYEKATYRRQELVLGKEDLLLSDRKQPSGYARPKVEATLPEQTMLLNRKQYLDRVKKWLD